MLHADINSGLFETGQDMIKLHLLQILIFVVDFSSRGAGKWSKNCFPAEITPVEPDQGNACAGKVVLLLVISHTSLSRPAPDQELSVTVLNS